MTANQGFVCWHLVSDVRRYRPVWQKCSRQLVDESQASIICLGSQSFVKIIAVVFQLGTVILCVQGCQLPCGISVP